MAVTKRGWRVILALALILIVVVAGQLIRASSAKQPAKRAATGATIAMGAMKWHVMGTSKVRELGNPDAPITAKGWFIVVDLSLTDATKKKVKVDPSAVVVVDKEKHVYPADKTATDSQARMYNGIQIMSLFNANLATQQPARVAAVFPIGEAASGLKLKVIGAKVGVAQDLLIDIGF